MKRRKVGDSGRGRPRCMSTFLTSSSRDDAQSNSSRTLTQSQPGLPQSCPRPTSPPPQHVMHEELPEIDTSTRGHSKGVPEWRTGVKIQLSFNSQFQVVGERTQQFKSQLGIIVRDGHRVPLTFIDWMTVDEPIKEGIWQEVKENVLNVPENFRVVLLQICNKLWKDHKSRIKNKYFVKYENDPQLVSRVPPNVVTEQWSVLVEYWRSPEAKAESSRNANNREKLGPLHNTGRRSFAEIREDMEKDGQSTDKMSVWIKSRNPTDYDVIVAIEDFQNELSKEPEDQQHLTVVRDKVFHRVMGEDAHGYCRTFGRGVPRSSVYQSGPLAPTNTPDFIQNLTKEITEKVTREVIKANEDMIRQYEIKYQQVLDRLALLESNDGRSGNSVIQGGTSVHQNESIGEGQRESAAEEVAREENPSDNV